MANKKGKSFKTYRSLVEKVFMSISMLELTGDKDKYFDAIANKMIELYGTPFDDVKDN